MDMKDQRFGIEIEMTGVTREQAPRLPPPILEHRPDISVPDTTPTRRWMVRAASGNL